MNPRRRSSYSARLLSLTAALCAIGALMVALLEYRTIDPSLANGSFAAVSAIAYAGFFWSHRNLSGSGNTRPGLRATLVLAAALIVVIAAIVGVILTSSWQLLVAASLLLAVGALILKPRV